MLVFGFWPLGNPRYNIVYKAENIAFHDDFLKQAKQAFAAKDSIGKRPNIVLILADDLGLYDISYYNPQAVKTPNINAIAEQGVSFSEGYISSPICAPSRAGLMTGRYQQRFGFEINIHERYPKNRLEYFVYANLLETGDWKVAQHKDWAVPTFEAMQKQGLPPTEFTLAELLQTQGYQTAIMGKWHLGYNPLAIPINRGFNDHYGFYEAFSLYSPKEDPSIVNQTLDDFSDSHIWGKARTGNCAIRWNDSIVNSDTYLTTEIAQKTNEWIAAHQADPFFVYVPFSAPHTPFQAPKAYYDLYKDIKAPEKRIYYAMIHALDDAVGSIMQQIDDLGLAENTLVIFLSDNGGATYTHATDNGPLKGGKFTNFEGGIRVPFFMRWSGVLPKGTVYKAPVSALDIFATANEVAQTPLPKDRAFDGVSLLPYLLDSTYQDKQPHQSLYWRSEYHKAVRSGDWKLIQDDLAQQTVLYNITNDPNETTNVANTEATIVQQLQDSLQLWETKLRPSSWPRVMDYEIKEGAATYYFPL